MAGSMKERVLTPFNGPFNVALHGCYGSCFLGHFYSIMYSKQSKLVV